MKNETKVNSNYLSKLLLTLGLCLILLPMFAQNKTITGKVVDLSGEPIIGASIKVVGTTTGTITDAKGFFTLTKVSKDKLLISYIGYKSTEEEIGNRTIINVTLMEDAKMLQEAVVIAEFGVKRVGRSIGAAVQNVKGSDIAESGRENFIDALQGRVSGVNITASSGSPGASSTVVFRAPTSISGNNSPLYVIDGVPMSNTTFDMNSQLAVAPSTSTTGSQNDYSNRGSDINPNDIENVTVLKGAAAASLYGSDASNGAIIITTKKGRSGAVRVTYSNNIKFDQVNRVPEFQTTYDQGSYGTTNYYNSKKWGAAYAPGTKLYDNLNNLFQTGVSQQHNLAFDAGNDVMTIRASAGLIDQTGVVKVAGYTRKNISVAGTLKLAKWMTLSSSMQYVNSTNTKVAKGAGGVLDQAMTWPQTDDMRNYLASDGSSMRYPNKYQDIDILNPYFDIYKDKRYDVTDRFISTMNLTISPVKDLEFRALVGWDTSASTYITSINPQFTGSVTKSGSFDQSNVVESDPTINLLASYTKKFDKFDFSLSGGYNQQETGSKTLAVHGSNFYVQDFQSINNCDPLTIVDLSSTRTRRVQALFGSFGASYNDMAFVTLRARNDWTSTLPVANNSYFYPALDVSFMLSELPFMKKYSDTWNYVKLRGSVARVGKDATPLSILPALTLQTTTGAGFAYGFYGPNTSLKPELDDSWEVGVEGRLFNNRLNFDWAYYNTDSKDQIIQGFRMSYATGFILNNRNMGSFRTRGTEFLVNYDFLKTKDWTINIGVNGSRNWSKVLALPAGVTEYYNSATWLSGNIRNGIMVGSPITTITGNDYQRNKKGQILIDPTTGTPLVNSTWSVIGDREAKLNFGFTASVKYKNVSLSCLMSGKLGTQVVNGTKRIMMANGTSPESVAQRTMGPVVFTGVLKDGKQDSDTPTTNKIAVRLGDLTGGYTGADPDWIEKNVNYLNMSELRLSYSFDKKLLSKLTGNLVSALSVYAAGTDLFMLTNYSGIDPAGNGTSSAVGGTGGVGFDMLSIGATRGISCGLNITF
jgi:TonB-linked SusC/RagA family outer membrane protein